MSKTIQHKRSSFAGNQPNASQIEVGELAINFADRSIYTKDGSNIITELARDIWRTDIAPDSAQEGDLWYDMITSEIKFYDGASWEQISGSQFVNLDGGSSSSTYLTSQVVDGGSA